MEVIGTDLWDLQFYLRTQSAEMGYPSIGLVLELRDKDKAAVNDSRLFALHCPDSGTANEIAEFLENAAKALRERFQL